MFSCVINTTYLFLTCFNGLLYVLKVRNYLNISNQLKSALCLVPNNYSLIPPFMGIVKNTHIAIESDILLNLHINYLISE